MFWKNLKKNITDPKVLIFLFTLFSTNGLQAYFSGDSSKVAVTKECPKISAKECIEIPTQVTQIFKCDVIEHEKEHHGRK